MKKLFLCVLVLAILCGCTSSKPTEETNTDKEETVVTEQVYQDFLSTYFADENRKSDYPLSSSPYTFTDTKEADTGLIAKQLGCEAINEDVLGEVNDIHQNDVTTFENLLKSFEPVLDETISFNNNNNIIMLKSGTNILYIANDNNIKLVLGDIRCTMKLTNDEVESLLAFLQNNLDSYANLGFCK